MDNPLRLFATTSRGIEPLLASELTTLGAVEVQERNGGVSFAGDLVLAYRACLWSRLASRILLPLTRFPLQDADGLYAAASAVDWPDLFDIGCSFAIEVAGRSPTVTHTHYAGLKVKDAIADRFRAHGGKRPDVDTERPDIRIHLHLEKEHAALSLDLSGESLHRRGYRKAGAAAPLKENLAAAILMRAGWAELAAQDAPLLDPLCGSGTLVLEAALMAADIAPGLEREGYGFEAWNDHRPKLWRDLLDEARERRSAGLGKLKSTLAGQDIDESAITAARENAKRAGLADRVQFDVADLAAARPAASTPPGLIVANPPYGERLGSEAEIIKLYSLLGATLKQHFGSWHAAIFTGRPDFGPRLGLRAEKMYSLYNGPLPCKLLCFEIPPVEADAAVTGGEDFANRLRKNLKHLGKWARRSGVSSYRLYDADLPDYAVAVDVYQSTELHVHVQEYAAPKTVDPVRAERRLREALAVIQRELEVPAGRIHFKIRKPQRGSSQYQKQGETGHFHEIEEHGCRLLVNFEDYLDTGIFLDHRALRRRIQQEASGKRFLNLFCYTASATAHAAKGSATSTMSVDMSNTYLEWASRNLRLNGVEAQLQDKYSPPVSRAPPHVLLRADCMVWLREQAEKPKQTFDLILCDPPTFSTSKRMEETLDTQRDHVELIRLTSALLAPGGRLYFSTNRRRFKLDTAALADLKLTDITAQTLDEDFRRPPPSHRCWQIEK